jgi:hypothetical protein
MIWVYARFNPDDIYFTLCTPKCAAAIDAYLDYHRRFGEQLKDKSPLMSEQFNVDNPFTIQSPRFLSIYAYDILCGRGGAKAFRRQN